MNHSLLPSTQAVRTATLPQKYEAAKVALAECNHIDECKDWGDKMQALASYARQSEDKEMEKTAMRIRARAVRRCGVLLKEIEKAQGKRTDKPHIATGTKLSRTETAAQAGMSKRQKDTALQVANVPEDAFEEQIESDEPPTVTSLAEQGMMKGIPIYEQLGMTKKAFQAGMYFQGALREFVKETVKYDPQDVADGSDSDDRKQMKQNIKTIEQYLTKLKAKI